MKLNFDFGRAYRTEDGYLYRGAEIVRDGKKFIVSYPSDFPTPVGIFNRLRDAVANIDAFLFLTEK